MNILAYIKFKQVSLHWFYQLVASLSHLYSFQPHCNISYTIEEVRFTIGGKSTSAFEYIPFTRENMQLQIPCILRELRFDYSVETPMSMFMLQNRLVISRIKSLFGITNAYTWPIEGLSLYLLLLHL